MLRVCYGLFRNPVTLSKPYPTYITDTLLRLLRAYARARTGEKFLFAYIYSILYQLNISPREVIYPVTLVTSVTIIVFIKFFYWSTRNRPVTNRPLPVTMLKNSTRIKILEKYIRLLSPKTTNFDSIGGGSHGALTAQDVCVAMSYAKLSPLQDNLVRMKCLGANTSTNVELLGKHLVQKYRDLLSARNVSDEYHEPVVRTALIEFCMVPASYTNTVRNRGVLAGVHYLVVHRYLNASITAVLEDIEREYSVANEKLFFQLNKTN